jgi:hypothetical protein
MKDISIIDTTIENLDLYGVCGYKNIKKPGLAERLPPLVRIEGPRDRLPQWESDVSLKDVRIIAISNQEAGQL